MDLDVMESDIDTNTAGVVGLEARLLAVMQQLAKATDAITRLEMSKGRSKRSDFVRLPTLAWCTCETPGCAWEGSEASCWEVDRGCVCPWCGDMWSVTAAPKPKPKPKADPPPVVHHHSGRDCAAVLGLRTLRWADVTCPDCLKGAQEPKADTRWKLMDVVNDDRSLSYTLWVDAIGMPQIPYKHPQHILLRVERPGRADELTNYVPGNSYEGSHLAPVGEWQDYDGENWPPCEMHDKVQVEFRSGARAYAFVRDYRWGHLNDNSDITRFRRLPTATSTTNTEG